MEHHVSFIKYLLDKGGPDLEDYTEVDAWLQEIMDGLKSGKLNNQEIQAFLVLLGDAATNKTIQGFVLQKPHGYAGDFEVIDKIYQKHTSEEPLLKKWDLYFHTHSATQAVRNRVDYFAEQIITTFRSRNSESNIEILNLASGPGRDMLNFFEQYPEIAEKISIDCIEQDVNAIAFARKLCENHSNQVSFIQRNALKYTTTKKYDLIWSAGLFD